MPQVESSAKQPDITCSDFLRGLAEFDVERDRSEAMHARVANSSNRYVRGTVEEATTRNAVTIRRQADKRFERFAKRPEWRIFEVACQRRYRDRLNSKNFDLLLADVCHESGIDFLRRPLVEFADALRPASPGNAMPTPAPVETPPSSCFERFIRFETDFKTQVRREWAKSGVEDRSEDVLRCLGPLWIIHSIWHNFALGSLQEGELTTLGIAYINLIQFWRKLDEILSLPDVRRALMLTHDTSVFVAGMKLASFSESGRQLLVDHINLFGAEYKERVDRWMNVPGESRPTMSEAELRCFGRSMRNYPQFNFSGAMPADADKLVLQPVQSTANDKGDSQRINVDESTLVTIQQIVDFAKTRFVPDYTVRRVIKSAAVTPVNPERSGAEPHFYRYDELRPHLAKRFKRVDWPEALPPAHAS